MRCLCAGVRLRTGVRLRAGVRLRTGVRLRVWLPKGAASFSKQGFWRGVNEGVIE